MEALEPQDAETEDFEEENSADPNLYDLPVVTIFGGGIAGLSTAHELIERGFDVQLVEAVESKFGEYDCDVGGLAANQYSRVPASTKELHGPLLKGYTGEERACLKALRAAKLFQAQPRFPLLETIRFDREAHGLPKPKAKRGALKKANYQVSGLEPDQAPPAKWTDYWDDFGTLNATKLTRVLEQLRDAYDHYLREFRDKIVQISNIGWTQFINEQHSDMAIREVLFVRITAYTNTDGTAEGNRALAEHWANEVRDELIRMNNSVSAQSAIPSLDKQDMIGLQFFTARWMTSCSLRRREEGEP